jgi:hypothetical protein
VVPAGAEYTITWQPTTLGTVTIVLLKGPAENIIPVAPLAEHIPNSGTFSWTPDASLEPTGDRGYGLQIINDADGLYQWSTQFGIANDGFVASASGSASASASASVTAAGNETISSAAASSSVAGVSNSTAAITSAPSEPTEGSTTLTRATSAGGASASPSSSSTTSSNAAVALGALSMGGVFAVVMAAAAAL